MNPFNVTGFYADLFFRGWKPPCDAQGVCRVGAGPGHIIRLFGKDGDRRVVVRRIVVGIGILAKLTRSSRVAVYLTRPGDSWRSEADGSIAVECLDGDATGTSCKQTHS